MRLQQINLCTTMTQDPTSALASPFRKLSYGSCGVAIPTECSLLAHLPPVLSDVATVEKMLILLSSSKACNGNSDDRFMALLPQRDVFRDCTGMKFIIIII